jgi:hypothetical protein
MSPILCFLGIYELIRLEESAKQGGAVDERKPGCKKKWGEALGALCALYVIAQNFSHNRPSMRVIMLLRIEMRIERHEWNEHWSNNEQSSH